MYEEAHYCQKHNELRRGEVKLKSESFFFKELNKIHKSLKKNEVFIKRLLWEHTASIETVSWD